MASAPAVPAATVMAITAALLAAMPMPALTMPATTVLVPPTTAIALPITTTFSITVPGSPHPLAGTAAPTPEPRTTASEVAVESGGAVVPGTADGCLWTV